MNGIRFLSRLIVVLAMGLFVSCGGSDETTPDPTTGIDADFSSLSSDVMPVVDSAVEGLLNNRLRAQEEAIETCADDWTCNNVAQGNLAFQLYRLLADADDDPAFLNYPDEGSFTVHAWGVENLQNELSLLGIMAGSLTGEDAGSVTEEEQGDTYNAELADRNEFSPPQAISPMPYAGFGSLTDETYQYHRIVDLSGGGQDGNLHLAWKVEGDVTNLLAGNTWMNESGGVHERAIYLGRYDEGTGFLALNVAMWTEQGFLPQWEILGNPTDHSFQAKYRKVNIGQEGGYNMSLVGLGVSQGEDEHFLFKVKEWEADVTEDEALVVYYCVSAEATREDFGLAYGNGGTDEFNEVPDMIKTSTDPIEGWCGGQTYETEISGIDFLTGGGTAETDFDSEFLDNL